VVAVVAEISVSRLREALRSARHVALGVHDRVLDVTALEVLDHLVGVTSLSPPIYAYIYIYAYMHGSARLRPSHAARAGGGSGGGARAARTRTRTQTLTRRRRACRSERLSPVRPSTSTTTSLSVLRFCR
jgi:hypothetical protein